MPPSELDRAAKHWREAEISVYDAYCFAYVRAGMHAGNIQSVCVEVGSTPLPDSLREGNNKALSKIANYRPLALQVSWS